MCNKILLYKFYKEKESQYNNLIRITNIHLFNEKQEAYKAYFKKS